jgi:hypothetical protein
MLHTSLGLKNLSNNEIKTYFCIYNKDLKQIQTFLKTQPLVNKQQLAAVNQDMRICIIKNYIGEDIDPNGYEVTMDGIRWKILEATSNDKQTMKLVVIKYYEPTPSTDPTYEDWGDVR